jgi:hypothetical protein
MGYLFLTFLMPSHTFTLFVSRTCLYRGNASCTYTNFALSWPPSMRQSISPKPSFQAPSPEPTFQAPWLQLGLKAKRDNRYGSVRHNLQCFQDSKNSNEQRSQSLLKHFDIGQRVRERTMPSSTMSK